MSDVELSDMLSPEALKHWAWTENRRARTGARDCVCPLCESVPMVISVLAEERRSAAEKAWTEGFDLGDGVGTYSSGEIAALNPYAAKEAAPDGR